METSRCRAVIVSAFLRSREENFSLSFFFTFFFTNILILTDEVIQLDIQKKEDTYKNFIHERFFFLILITHMPLAWMLDTQTSKQKSINNKETLENIEYKFS